MNLRPREHLELLEMARVWKSLATPGLEVKAKVLQPVWHGFKPPVFWNRVCGKIIFCYLSILHFPLFWHNHHISNISEQFAIIKKIIGPRVRQHQLRHTRVRQSTSERSRFFNFFNFIWNLIFLGTYYILLHQSLVIW
jgi:hypothetical protein